MFSSMSLMKGLRAPLVHFFGRDEMDLAVNILENLTEVPRFDTLIMFLSSKEKAGTHIFS